ncbi:MAG: TlpA family protein disulfide reductase [Clostridia bacterium]|nr:TlpA family protein disulfide reductase [Clostridia bacterium]
MKKNKKKLLVILLALLIVLGGGYLFYAKYADHTEPDQALPAQTQDKTPLSDFTVYDADHNEFASANLKGKPAVINFWATWCPPCCAELPDFNSAYEQYGNDVQFVMVNLTDGERETEAGVRAFLEENGYTFPVYYDLRADASYAYAVNSIPFSVFVDQDGNVYTTHLGMLSASELYSTIEALLKA